MTETYTQEELLEQLKELEKNELYQKSTAFHKDMQFRQFYNEYGVINGVFPRLEDRNGVIEGQPQYDENSRRMVIYNFKNGVLHSENDLPALQFQGHWEYWNNGMIIKVVDSNGDTEEYWEDGVPVHIETGLIDKYKAKKG